MGIAHLLGDQESLGKVTGTSQGRLFQSDVVEPIRIRRNTTAGCALGFYNSSGFIVRIVADPNAKLLKLEYNNGSGGVGAKTIASWG